MYFTRLGCLFAAALTLSPAFADDWRDYRRAFPLHIQEFALTAETESGARTLILSEPPPSLSTDEHELRVLFEAAFGQGSVDSLRWRKKEIMLDGWVRDLEIKLVPAAFPLNDEAVDDAVSWLSWHVFGSAEGAYWRDLSVPSKMQTKAAPESLDLSVSELANWLDSEGLSFKTPEGEKPFRALLTQGKTGVFSDTSDTLVAWIFNRSALHDDGKAHAFGPLRAGSLLPGSRRDWQQQGDFRDFSLSTDLIVGAAQELGIVAIIGRVRSTSYDALPPLRFEEVRRLAASAGQHAELGQSYERNHAFGGKVIAGWFSDWDVAPIYLSDELWDSEFGSTLNIADQLLKSWSQATNIQYFNFPYPKPNTIPFGMPLSERMRADGLRSQGTLFNWNTVGAATILSGDLNDREARSYAVPTRTGSLPLTYQADIGGQMTSNEIIDGLEDIGWDYFVTQRDPVLARVVQYTFLYQVFRQFGVSAPDATQEPLSRSATVEAEMTALVRQALKNAQQESGLPEFYPQMIRNIDFEDRMSLNFEIARGRACLQSKLPPLLDFHPDMNERLVKAIVGARDYSFDWDNADVTALFAAADRNDGSLARVASERTARSAQVRAAYSYLASSDISECLKGFLNGTPFIKRLVDAADAEPAVGHIKTPLLVLSKDISEEGYFSVGGHNLDSAVPRIRERGFVEPGRPQISADAEGNLVISLNRADIPRSQRLSRIAERYRGEGASRLEQRLAEALVNRPVRPIRTALKLDTDAPAPTPALRETARTPKNAAAEVSAARTRLDEAGRLAIEGPNVLYVETTPGGIVIVRGGRPPADSVFATMPAAVARMTELIGTPPPAANIVYGPQAARSGQSIAMTKSLSASPETALRASEPRLAALGGGNGGQPPSSRTATIAAGGEGPRRPYLQTARGDVTPIRAGWFRSKLLRNTPTVRNAPLDSIPASLRSEIAPGEVPLSYHVVDVMPLRTGFLSRLNLRLDIITASFNPSAKGADVPAAVGRAGAQTAREETPNPDLFMRRLRDDIIADHPDLSVYLMFSNGNAELILSLLERSETGSSHG